MREFGKVYNGKDDVYMKNKSGIIWNVWKCNNICHVVPLC